MIKISIMNQDDHYKLLCIPHDGIPFEALGTHSARREENIQKTSVIIELVKREFGEDIIGAPPFLIKPELITHNIVWEGVEQIISGACVRSCAAGPSSTMGDSETGIYLGAGLGARVFVPKNDKLYRYNKYVNPFDGYRPKGNIYIWISSSEYNRYKCNLEQQDRTSMFPNSSYMEKEFTINSSTVYQPCRCYTCLTPNLVWTMANL